MKLMNKQVLAGLALLGMTSGALAYDFTFNNKTDSAIAVKLNLAASLADFDDMAVVQPGTSHTFSFTGFKSGFCLSKIVYGALGQQALTPGAYPKFVEAAQYTTVAATSFDWNACQSMSFDITRYGNNFIVGKASK